ncbi:MAG TPA: tetratricopeptide repeat protein [Polyangiaceae bacterium]|jgi:hypothetical protein|nr:tetratricopeptide repeat protein [Polyangiaceae bacterium]
MSPAPDLDLLDSLTRDELIERARELGTNRPEVMTRVELRDEIVRLSEPDVMAQKRQRGWLGVARDLVASVVESGLNMRDAAAKIRGERGEDLVGPPPVATVTLAEIYIAQGHPDRALGIVNEVLDREPDHAAALALRERLRAKEGTAERRRSRVPEAEPDTTPPPEPELAPVEMAPAPQSVFEIVPQPVIEEAPFVELACVLERAATGWTARWQGATQTGLVLRVAAFVAGKPKPQLMTHDVDVAKAEGSASLPTLPLHAIVRGAVGTLDGDTFRPLAVAVVMDDAKAVYRPPGQGTTPLERAI